MKTLYTGITCPDAAFVHTPLIEIRPVSDDTQLRQMASDMEAYDYLLFTSRFAVKYFPGRCRRTVSIGNATSEALRAAGIETFEQVERDNSYGVIEWFGGQPRGRVLIPRSNLALDIIPEGLRKLGFEVTTVTAYENRMPKNAQKVDLGEIDRIVFTSPSTIDNFIRLYGALPADKDYVTRGPITREHLATIIKQQSL